MKFSPAILLILALRSVAFASEPAQAAAGPLTVTPAGGVSQTIPQGGPFAPASQSYTLTNTGTAPLDFTVAATQAWVTVFPSSGTIAAGGTTNVMVAINGVAITLAPGTFTDTVTFTNTTNGAGNQTRPVSLTVTGVTAGALSVTSSGAWFTSVGNPGGPFSPASMAFTLTNTGTSSIDYTVTNTQTFVGAAPAGGTLAGGATTTVTVSITAAANTLAAGTHQDLFTFTNTTNGNGTTQVPAVLMISPPGVVMTVTPSLAFNPTGPVGGPFTPPSTTYTVTNVSPQPMTISISKTQPWLDIAPAIATPTTTLPIGVSLTYQILVNAAANSLPPGTYTDTITITNVTSGQNNTTRLVTLTVTPATGDTTPPTVVITTPVPPTATATSSPATVSGTAADNLGVTSVTWTNGRTGGNGTATGTTAWSASIPLAPGNNLVTLTARDAAGNAGSATLTLVFSPPGGDTVPPVLAITTPTSGPTHNAASSPVSLGGTASDNVTVSTVTWSNGATGTSGTATGTTTWSAMVDLVAGSNAITVTAFDASGNSSSATLTVTLGGGAPVGAGGKKKDDGTCGMGSVAAPGPGLWVLAASLLAALGIRRRLR